MKKVIYIIFSLVLFSCHSTKSTAQNKKSQDYYVQADNALAYGKFDEALALFDKAIALDDKYLDAHIQRANLYQNYYKEYDKAAAAYEKVLKLDASLMKGHYNAAICYMYMHDFSAAKNHILTYLEKAKLSKKGRWSAEMLLQSIDFSEQSIQSPVSFEPQNLGNAINTADDEYFPSIIADNSQLYFTVKARNNRYSDENIYVSSLQDDGWAFRKKLSGNINTDNTNEGAHAITADGKYLFYASDNRNTNLGKFDIFMAKNIGNQWQSPVNLGPEINTREWESQPMLSADGRSLYFVAKREGGFGGSDIYVSYLGNDGKFGVPQNLGENINTMGDEQRPQLHPDGTTLYFSSDGHAGMGSLDIFMSTRDEDGDWSSPINLGYPINTVAQELGMYVAADGNLAYVASEREGGFGGLDIYSFELPTIAKPLTVVNVKGLVYDELSEDPLKGLIKVFNLSTGKLYKVISSDEVNGRFLLSLPAGENYMYEVTVLDYLPFSANFSLKNIDNFTTYNLDVPLRQVAVGKEFTLENIFFDTNSAELKEESKVELNQLVKFLDKNSTIKIEIGGHTDDVGSEDTNQLLSQNRAKSVLDYLVANGIAGGRLSHKGYGESAPLIENNSDENRAKNRRTTFKVI